MMYKKHNIRLLCTLALTFTTLWLHAQYYNLGQDPASVNWREIKTPHFRIIYPEIFEPRVQKMRPTLNFAYNELTKSLAYKPKPIPIIIHNYNIDANAVTVWAPKRVEYVWFCNSIQEARGRWLQAVDAAKRLNERMAACA